MAFNPNHYETIYGFSTLDELHNFMPEMLYDDAIFSNEIVAFMRHRVRTLFRDTYIRQHHLYMMYNASQRRQSFAEWRRGRMAPLRDAPPLPTANNQASASMVTEEEVNAAINLLSSAVFPTNGALTAGGAIGHNTVGTLFRNANRTNAPTTPANTTTTVNNPPPIRRTRDSLQYVMETTIPAGLFQNTPGSLSLLLGGMLNELGGIGGGGGGGGRNIWTDVDVSASAAEISTGSSIVEESALPTDINCAICQEHTYAEGGNHQWRRLYCSHQFHIECIDPWLQQNVHCPVCRADIRESSANAGAGVGTGARRTYAAAAAAGSEPASTS